MTLRNINYRVFEQQYSDQGVITNMDVVLVNMRLAEHRLTRAWYLGEWSMNSLTIRSNRLDAIAADAFSSWPFLKLDLLAVYVQTGSVDIHPDAFNGLEHLDSVMLDLKHIVQLPQGLFDPIAGSLSYIRLRSWSNQINLNVMFANEAYRNLEELKIYDVQMPQTAFRLLSAANFTAFRRMRRLNLINCGVEVIAEHAFDRVGRTLERILLYENPIKCLTIDMFRIFFESKAEANLVIKENRVKMPCTLSLIELDVMLYPFVQHSTDMNIECQRNENFLVPSLDVYRSVDIQRFCISPRDLSFLRIIKVHVKHLNGTIFLDTNFTSCIRVIFGHVDAMQRDKSCMERKAKTNFKCFRLNSSTGEWHLRDIVEVHDAKFISITVIPILYGFGAQLLHSITVRQMKVAERRQFDTYLLWIAMVCCISGVSCGLVAGIWLARTCIWDGVHTKQAANESPDDYEYCGHIEMVPIDIGENHPNLCMDQPSEPAAAQGLDADDIDYYDEFGREPLASPNDYM